MIFLTLICIGLAGLFLNGFTPNNYQVYDLNSSDLKTSYSINEQKTTNKVIKNLEKLRIKPKIQESKTAPTNLQKTSSKQVYQQKGIQVIENSTGRVLPTISIPRIEIYNQTLATGSMQNLDDLYEKMLYQPVLEKKLTVDLCADYANSYVLGHSEPSSERDKYYPGDYVFSRLHQLVPGDLIYATSTTGTNCTYKVIGWDEAVTDSEDRVSKSVFYNALYPEFSKPTLTIQTCKIGSATERLLLREEKIS